VAEFVLAGEPLLRLGSFAGILVLMVAWETLAPRRGRSLSRWRRWPNNLGIVALNTGMLRILFPVSAVAASLIAAEHGWGVLNALILPDWIEVLVAIVALDMAIYFQHRVFHAVPLLWRLHRMHHADLDLDVTTGARFHPLEILLSMAIKVAVVVLLGAPAIAVVLFEILLNATSMFNHANLRLPPAVDLVLRWLIVTPDVHRIHHSVIRAETNSNFGFSLSCWDRLFGTYRAQPCEGHDKMTLGLSGFRNPAELRIDRMLVQPFVRGDVADP
jgi:sterol desaturase/sphingolipid hydroxylase (fatty acid hydroxylase superfamily)